MMVDRRGSLTLLEGRTHLKLETARKRYKGFSDEILNNALDKLAIEGYAVVEIPC